MKAIRRSLRPGKALRESMDSAEYELARQLYLHVLSAAKDKIPGDDPDRESYLASIKLEPTPKGILVYSDDPESAALFEWGSAIDEQYPHWRIAYRAVKYQLGLLRRQLIGDMVGILQPQVQSAREAVADLT